MWLQSHPLFAFHYKLSLVVSLTCLQVHITTAKCRLKDQRPPDPLEDEGLHCVMIKNFTLVEAHFKVSLPLGTVSEAKATYRDAVKNVLSVMVSLRINIAFQYIISKWCDGCHFIYYLSCYCAIKIETKYSSFLTVNVYAVYGGQKKKKKFLLA